MQTGFHNDLAAVMKLETAFVSKKSTKAERIPMYANYRNAVVAELIIYRANEEVPRGRSASSMEMKLLAWSL
jgi:hypothetical protein